MSCHRFCLEFCNLCINCKEDSPMKIPLFNKALSAKQILIREVF